MGLAQQTGRLGARPHGHEDPFGRAAALLSTAGTPGRFHVAIDPLGHPAQRKLAKFEQVGAFEEPLRRPARDVGQVDFPSLEPFEQFFRWQIDQFNFVGAVERVVGHRFPDTDTRGLLDQVDKALDGLHVESGVHVDAGIDDRKDVLPALGMEQARRVGVGHLVDEQHLRPTGDRSLQVELAQRVAPIGHRQPRQDLQPLHERHGLGPAVRLDDAHDHVASRGHEPAGRFQHGIRLADAGGEAEKHLQSPARRPLLVRGDPCQQGIRIGA